MNEIRKMYLACLQVALGLIERPEVEQRWDEPSALYGWSVSGLAGHLTRAFTTVIDYLDADPAPTGETLTAAAYYASAVDTDDLDSELHRSIRRRGVEMAQQGHGPLVELQRRTLARLRAILDEEPGSRRVRVHKGMVVSLDDYLITRVVELGVHIDDLAVSVEVDTPPLPTAASDLAIDALVSTARHRHGDLGVLRALARRERDEVNALRVF
jgi:Mycothiol maleylpyruvate isomerase N-terminal domain